MDSFRGLLKNCSKVVILTGAGVSAESGVPTFRGADGLWRNFKATNLATPEAFNKNPSLVWEFYHFRREVMRTKEPNRAHLAIASFEDRLEKEGKKVTIVTQNIDELHKRAGSKNIIELHGSLFRTICTLCNNEQNNYESPICPALANKGAPDPNAKDAKIPAENLPHCKIKNCGGLLRPAVVWFGESLKETDLLNADKVLDECDMCLVVGTSSIVYPAAMFAPKVASRGVPVAEFNIEPTPATHNFSFHFEGPCGTTLPQALAPF